MQVPAAGLTDLLLISYIGINLNKARPDRIGKECVEMILDKEGKWNRRLCQEKLAFVCSKDKGWSGKVHNSCAVLNLVLYILEVSESIRIIF